MCGRYALTASEQELLRLFGFVDGEPFPPRYNIAPTQPIAIVRQAHGARRFALVRWGLVPSWVENPQRFSLLINARTEGILEKPSFKKRHALPPLASSPRPAFTNGGGRAGRSSPTGCARAPAGRSPSPASGKPGPTAMAARSIRPASSPPHANATVAPIHARMPVVVAPENFERWLADPDPEAAAALLSPAPDDLFEAFQVSDRVNKADGRRSWPDRAGRRDEEQPLR